MVLISINLQRTRISDFQFYNDAGSSNIKLGKCWMSESLKAASTRHSGSKIMLWFCYLYLHLIKNTFGFTELLASIIFFPKEDWFLRISIEGLKSGRLLPFLGTHTVKGKDSHTIQLHRFMFSICKDKINLNILVLISGGQFLTLLCMQFAFFLVLVFFLFIFCHCRTFKLVRRDTTTVFL